MSTFNEDLSLNDFTAMARLDRHRERALPVDRGRGEHLLRRALRRHARAARLARAVLSSRRSAFSFVRTRIRKSDEGKQTTVQSDSTARA